MNMFMRIRSVRGAKVLRQWREDGRLYFKSCADDKIKPVGADGAVQMGRKMNAGRLYYRIK